MSKMIRVLLAGMIALTLPAKAIGHETDAASSPKEYRWEDEAKAKGLREKDLQLLRQNKFVITGEPFKQIFSPYIGSDVPVFVTTDSLLNGFHVLFEESICRMEQAQARKLPGILDALTKKLDAAAKSFKGDAPVIDAARRRAAIFLGTARHLLDAKALPDDPALRKLVEEEAARVVAATGTSKPVWLGPPDDGFLAVDYTRFKPRGFYTKSPALERYFRAVSWLQAIPFRLDRDEELAAAFLMHRTLGDHQEKLHRDLSAFCGTFSEFLGAGDDWDFLALDGRYSVMTAKGLREARAFYQESAASRGRPQINDQLRFAPTTPGGKAEIGFRFLSAYRVPDAVMFQRTANPRLAKRDFPDGLEICAFLGSPFARAKLAKELPRVMAEIERCKPLLPRLREYEQGSIYADYLRCLAVLLERTEPDAPKFMHDEAWRIKTCQTALGGWAQMRYVWTLQVKQSIQYMSAVPEKAGFIEPVPEFYADLMNLTDRIRQTLNRAGAFDAAATAKERLDDFRAAIKVLEKAKKNKKGINALTAEEIRLLARFSPNLNDWETRSQEKKDSKSALESFQLTLAEFGEVKKEETAEVLRELADYLGGGSVGEHHWKELVNLCRELERMSHKQLRGVPWNANEERFLHSYGKELAWIMGYTGHAWMHPRDDAPRIVDVHSNPTVGKHLLVGIGKPRYLWVLYPVKGKEILCRGGVSPYHEFAHGKRLTDGEWRSLLASPQCPPQPAWLQPVVAIDR